MSQEDLHHAEDAVTSAQARIKVAESGVSAGNCGEVFALGFQAVLVGTSLLMDGRGVTAALHDFEVAMERGK